MTRYAQQPTESPMMDFNTPGGRAQNLRAAGVSKSYATKLALEQDRRQQGHLNNQMSPAARTDVLTSPMTGNPFYGQQRQHNDIANDFAGKAAPMYLRGMGLQNDAQGIANQYAPQFNQGEIDQTRARTRGMEGTEARQQGKFNIDQVQAPFRFAAEMGKVGAETRGIDAETGFTGAKTGSVNAETKAIQDGSAGWQQERKSMFDRMQKMQTELDRYRQIEMRNNQGGPQGNPVNEFDKVLNPDGHTDASEQVPTDASQRVKDKVYTTPKGKFKWTGAGWVPAN